MENFRRQFLTEAAENLRLLTDDFGHSELVSEQVRREAFRTLHTIKGTAQTFGFETSSRLAHELETLLSVTKTEENHETYSSKLVFLEGIKFLIESLEQKDFQIPASFAEKLVVLLPSAAQNISENNSIRIPKEIFAQLTAQEKIAVRAIHGNGKKNLYCFEINYDLATFADELINFRETLNEAGEIIATLPGLNSNAGKIGFRILYASRTEQSKIHDIGAANKANITFNSAADSLTAESFGIFEQIIHHGKTLAEQLGKKIEFEFNGDETVLPPDKLKLIFDAALHLVRNSVDHAIETSGNIKIDLITEENGWRLQIADDGRGVDLERIRAKAVEKNLIADDENLTETELTALIFQPEFSTKSGATEISGRGVGLDAVKSSLEKSGGVIRVESENGKGTLFEIFLPR